MAMTTVWRSSTILAALTVAAASACDVPTDVPEQATVAVRNRLTADTITTVYLTSCASTDTAPPNSLHPREVILPQADRAFEVMPGCYDVRFLNRADSVVDRRTLPELARGDSAIVVLRKL
jgi:hypothetical protein